MGNEVKPIKEKTRKVKNHIIDQYLRLATRVDEKGAGDLTEKEQAKYWELTTIFAKSVLPRTQEVTGEDGEPIKIAFDSVFNQTNAESTFKTTRDSTLNGQV